MEVWNLSFEVLRTFVEINIYIPLYVEGKTNQVSFLIAIKSTAQ